MRLSSSECCHEPGCLAGETPGYTETTPCGGLSGLQAESRTKRWCSWRSKGACSYFHFISKIHGHHLSFRGLNLLRKWLEFISEISGRIQCVLFHQSDCSAVTRSPGRPTLRGRERREHSQWGPGWGGGRLTAARRLLTGFSEAGPAPLRSPPSWSTAARECRCLMVVNKDASRGLPAEQDGNYKGCWLPVGRLTRKWQ